MNIVVKVLWAILLLTLFVAGWIAQDKMVDAAYQRGKAECDSLRTEEYQRGWNDGTLWSAKIVPTLRDTIAMLREYIVRDNRESGELITAWMNLCTARDSTIAILSEKIERLVIDVDTTSQEEQERWRRKQWMDSLNRMPDSLPEPKEPR